MINSSSKCLRTDRKLGVISISLRSMVDLLHLLLWSFYYENKWKEEKLKIGHSAATASSASGEENKSVSSRLSTGHKEEISHGNPHSLSPRNSKATGRLIEILCVLPLPQAAALAILIIKGNPRSQQAVTLLKFLVLGQYILRAFRVFPSFHEATTNSFTLLKSHFWIGAGFNLLLFVIASHVLGAFWYLLSVGRTMDCWKSACRNRVGCKIDSLFCGGPADNKTYLDDYCPIQHATNSSAFDFGIYLSALESNIVASTKFPLKLGYCFWWGLRNLSSLGQNLNTSAYEWEICFSICISIMGLILFSLFIDNMQAYFQHKTNDDLMKMKGKMDKVVKKQGELSNWKFFKLLPQKLKEDIASCIDEKWLDTPTVDLYTVLHYFPEDVSRKIKQNILWELQRKVKLFQALIKRAPSLIPKCIKPMVFEKGNHVFNKECPVDKLVFIINGKLKRESGSGDGFMSEDLSDWEFCGEELLKSIIAGWKTPQTSVHSPMSTADVVACTKVEAFVLHEADLLWVIGSSRGDMKDIHQCITASTVRAAVKSRAQKQSGMKRAGIPMTGGSRRGNLPEVIKSVM
ncbi:hypothetical protein MLD38_029191 [Melastoma candidum]|uniref:Uncharacterized protein n=1 Tax=Melastoma candidum TaxID=119954 RepID=A0ACB9N308_9MYRT|nr:hypothetical protein MLD38_029191 [Melastoma candidum]